MRSRSHAPKARKRIARKLEISASQVAEQALATEVAPRRAKELHAEIAKDLDAVSAYEAKYGSFAEMAREHYQTDDEDGSPSSTFS